MKIKEIWNTIHFIYNNEKSKYDRLFFTDNFSITSIDNYYIVLLYDEGSNISFYISIDYRLMGDPVYNIYNVSNSAAGYSKIVGSDDDLIDFVYDKKKVFIRDYKIKSIGV